MADLQDTPERFKLGEVGYTGARLFKGVSVEELKVELNHPNCFRTYKEMSYHPAINAPLSLYNAMVSKAKFRIKPIKDSSESEKQEALRVEEMLYDMDISLEDVVTDVMSMAVHGFSVVEKVYRKRLKSTGSLYDDGLIAPKKLAFRSQESIERFIFDDSGNEVLGVRQNLTFTTDPYGRFNNRPTTINLPRSKVMIFNVGRNKSTPYGTSPLRDVYVPWKYLTAIEELEAAGVAKDLQGLPVLNIPAEYMTEDASPEQKQIFEQFKNILRNLQTNTQSGIILPSTVDPDTKTKLFELDLLSTQGGKKNYDTDKVKEYYRAMIFIGLSADILLMGNTSTGSFALGNIKNTLTASTVEQYLKQIVKVFNDDLIRQIYELNGWNPARRCSLDIEAFQDVNLEEYSKAVQRMASVGMLPVTHDVVNKGLTALGIDNIDEEEDLTSILPDNTSRASDGMAKGSGNGTSDSVAGTDNSANNADNTA